MWIWAVWVVGAAVGAALVSGQGSLDTLESPELAWLLANESPAPPVPLRRITPKSVFLAPTFTSCSEGFQQDDLGRCVKVVKINTQAQWEFFLQKLNSMYSPPVRNKPPAGPLRLPIPIGEPETTSMPTIPPTTTEEPVTSTQIPTSTSKTMLPTAETVEPTLATDPTERETETPLLIIVANTTEPNTPTERDWSSRLTTTTSPPFETSELSAGMTTTQAMPTTTDCEGCSTEQTTTPSPLLSDWNFPESVTEEHLPYPQRSSPSTYLPSYPDTVPTTRRPLVRLPLLEQPTPEPPATPGLRPTWLPLPSRPTTAASWTTDSTQVEADSTSTRRTTVRFPTDPAGSYIRFPVHQSPVWWPQSWEQNLWPSHRPPSRPWGHREPRPSWIHQ